MMVLLFMCVCLCVFVHDLSMLEMRFVYCGLAFAISDMKWDKAVCVCCVIISPGNNSILYDIPLL